MVDTLATEDYVTIAVYFGIVLAVGLWVGASIYASNIGAPMFIGLAGTAAASGLAVTIYEWHAEIYSGAIFLRHILKWNMYLCVVVILAVTAVFTIVGIIQVGGWDEMTEKYMHSAANYTLMNQSLYSCGMPREDSLHIFRSATTGDIPWTGALTGLSIMGLYVWCQDQLIVQRTLSARDMAHAKAGTLLGGALKLLGLFTFIVPGMISRILYPDEIACADPDKCEAFCHNKAGCSNFAYPVLVLRLMPKGLRGLMLAALLAALMSSLTSILNSASAIATMDIWKQFRKKATQAELMVVGRVTVMILVVISIVWLPIMDAAQGGMFWFYFIGIRSYFLPQMCILFVLGLFWKRLTEQGAFWGLMISLVIGMIRMVLDFTFIKPSCGSGDEDTRPSIISKVDFTHFAAILAVLCCISMLRRVTWWTKDDDEDPELSSEDDEVVDEQRINKAEIIEDNGTALPVSFGQRFCKAFKDWVCGTTDEVHKHQYLTQREIIHLRKKMKSIDETALYRKVLNGAAIIMSLLTAFLIGKFS
ncbi:SGLT4 [Mytilus edulis]|uniref:SLC5A9 n=1 Tax=Mytilus edulis TaxID=6550 RepID=A0A8S3TSC4_MYTED|nr:SGLT4 [Mytilus edulis]